MRTCQSCGKENPADRDFCSCGEYLRWEPTGFVQAITPEMAAEAAAQAAPPKEPDPAPPRRPPPPPAAARSPPAARPEPGNGNGHSRRRAAAAAARRRRPPPADGGLAAGHRRADAAVRRSRAARRPRRWCAAPCRRAAARRRRDERNEPATIVLRLPERRPRQGRDAAPGRRAGPARARAGADPQPERDRRQLRPPRRGHAGGLVVDLPRHRLPRAVRLRRHLRAGGRDPPAPAARPRGRGAGVGAEGRRRLQGDAGSSPRSAPLALHIQPYIETATTLRPQRKKGRRKATFDVTVANKANAPVLVALDGEDPDGELQLRLQPPAAGDPGRRGR